MDLILKKASFPIRADKFGGVDEKGRIIYKPVLSVVHGQTFNYLGVTWGIYKKLHIRDARRKYDHVLVDLETGLGLFTAGRRSFMLEDLETAGTRQDLSEYLGSKERIRDIETFRELKKGKR